MPSYRRRYEQTNEIRAVRLQRRSRKGCLLLLVATALLSAFTMMLILVFTPLGSRIKRGLVTMMREIRQPEIVERIVEREVEREVIREVPVEAEPPQPPPTGFIPRREIDVANVFNGVHVHSEMILEQGGFATIEREDPESLLARFELVVRVPEPNDCLETLSRINQNLPHMLPGLEAMMREAKVSPYYHKLYENKTNRMRNSLARLDRILDRHNFFDLETILELTHPGTGARALLIQSEMDTCTDGSDGDRMPHLDDYITMSANYQPFTSYGWQKTTSQPNPLLPRWEQRLKDLEEEFAIPGLPVERNRQLRADIDYAKRAIADLKRRSFLVAEKDPYMVVSLAMLGDHADHPHGPQIGDYAVIIHDDKIYPCIVGDAGPTFKMGEASLKIAREINENSSPYSRPVSDLKVTYIVFPGSNEGRSQPDLDHWHQRISELLEGIGGIGESYELHRWPDPFAKPVEPEPEPEPESEPAPEDLEDPENGSLDPEAHDGGEQNGESGEAETAAEEVG